MKRPFVVALVTGVVLTAVMTYPLIVRPATVARFDSNDGKFGVWNVAWVAHALLDDPKNLFNANIFAPHPGTLAYSEPNLIAGILALPVYALFREPVAAHNVAIFVAMVLAFVLTWQLVRRLTGSTAAALVTATGFTFSSWMSSHTAHVQLLMVFVLPGALLAMHRYVERPTMGRGAGLGLALALAGLSCSYFGFAAGLAIGLGILWFAPGQPSPGRYWIGVVVAVIVTIATVAPMFLPYLELRRTQSFKAVVDLNEAQYYAADAGAYLRTPSFLYRGLSTKFFYRADGLGEVIFPGLVVTVFAVAGAMRLRRSGARERENPAPSRRLIGFYITLTLLAMWASFGPAAGLYAWLTKVIPFMSFLRAPARFGPLALIGLAVLAGIGLRAWLRTRPQIWLAPILVAIAAGELATKWPLATIPPVPEAYQRLAQLPRGAVVEFHFPYKSSDLHNHAKFMFWSMWHWQPLVNGYSDFIPDDIREIATPINAFPNPESLRIMRERGVRYVTLTDITYLPAEVLKSMLDRFPPYAEYVRPLIETGPVRLYEIVKYPD